MRARSPEPTDLPCGKRSHPLPPHSQLWTDAHAPRAFADLAGTPREIQRIQAWALTRASINYAREPAAIFVHGPPGIGKTSLVRILATLFDICTFDLDSAHYDAAQIIAAAGASELFARAIMKQPRLVVIDEIDMAPSLRASATLEIIKKLVTPRARCSFLIMANTTNARVSAVAGAAGKIKTFAHVALSPLPLDAMVALGNRIAHEHGLHFSAARMASIASEHRGDARALLNALQTQGSKGDTAARDAVPPLDLSITCRGILVAASSTEIVALEHFIDPGNPVLAAMLLETASVAAAHQAMIYNSADARYALAAMAAAAEHASVIDATTADYGELAGAGAPAVLRVSAGCTSSLLARARVAACLCHVPVCVCLGTSLPGSMARFLPFPGRVFGAPKAAAGTREAMWYEMVRRCGFHGSGMGNVDMLHHLDVAGVDTRALAGVAKTRAKEEARAPVATRRRGGKAKGRKG